MCLYWIIFNPRAAEVISLEIAIIFSKSKKIEEVVNIATVIKENKNLLVVARRLRWIKGEHLVRWWTLHSRRIVVQVRIDTVAHSAVVCNPIIWKPRRQIIGDR